jgi:hypothetical protein
MKKNNRSLLVLLALASIVPAVTQAANETRGQIGNLFPPSLTQPCVLFTLIGVAQADPVNPGNPWFAISSTHPGFDKLYALLLAAKPLTVPAAYNVQSPPTLIVQTTGNAVCGGFAEVNYTYWADSSVRLE